MIFIYVFSLKMYVVSLKITCFSLLLLGVLVWVSPPIHLVHVGSQQTYVRVTLYLDWSTRGSRVSVCDIDLRTTSICIYSIWFIDIALTYIVCSEWHCIQHPSQQMIDSADSLQYERTYVSRVMLIDHLLTRQRTRDDSDRAPCSVALSCPISRSKVFF